MQNELVNTIMTLLSSISVLIFLWWIVHPIIKAVWIARPKMRKYFPLSYLREKYSPASTFSQNRYWFDDINELTNVFIYKLASESAEEQQRILANEKEFEDSELFDITYTLCYPNGVPVATVPSINLVGFGFIGSTFSSLLGGITTTTTSFMGVSAIAVDIIDPSKFDPDDKGITAMYEVINKNFYNNTGKFGYNLIRDSSTAKRFIDRPKSGLMERTPFFRPFNPNSSQIVNGFGNGFNVSITVVARSLRFDESSDQQVY